MATNKRTSRASNGTLQPPEGGVAIRMYRHGLGDCFLLAFDKRRSKKPCYVLIDCGVHTRQEAGNERLSQVMDDIGKTTGGKLDIVVATHEHTDHLSGFVQKQSPFISKKLAVNRFWTTWTERLDDDQAIELRRRRGAAREAVQKALEELKKRNDATQLAVHVASLMDFEDLREAELDPVFLGAKPGAKAAAVKPVKPSSGAIALELLAQHARKVEYCEPGSVLELPGVDNVRAYVLGPPRDERLLKRDQPGKGARQETYLTNLAEQRTFALAPAFGDGRVPADLDPDLCYPFERAVRRGIPAADESDADALQKLFHDHYYERGNDWRQIENDWLGLAEDLALNLDNDTNNTSLVLAFEWGPVGQGQVFLFVGDAQVGNWLSWAPRTYQVDGQTVSAESLLARTIVYKVGHHGSHNATIRRDPSRPSAQHPDGAPAGLELMPPRLIALIPVDREAVRKPVPWHMPYPKLYERLLQKAAGRVLRSDGMVPSTEEIDIPAWSPADGSSQPPGLINVQWHEATTKFSQGHKCPLYYDLFFKKP